MHFYDKLNRKNDKIMILLDLSILRKYLTMPSTHKNNSTNRKSFECLPVSFGIIGLITCSMK